MTTAVVHDTWDSYVADAEDGPMFVSFDMEAAQEDLAASPLQKCVRVQIPIKKRQENGAPQEKEAEHLYKLEDQLVEALAKNDVNCLFVARVTHGGVREIVFQIEDLTAFGNVAKEWQDKIKDYKIEYERHEGWEFFTDVVMPGPEEWIAICDRRVMDTLISEGADPEKPHQLEYVFQGPPDALRTISEQLQGKGYSPVGEPDFEKSEVVLGVQMPLDLEQIVEHSIANDELAVQHGARCEGWGAQPVA
ncbi:MAG: DUF695 domain-containing protein [Myxococcaceae bacterium]